MGLAYWQNAEQELAREALTTALRLNPVLSPEIQPLLDEMNGKVDD